MKVIKFDIYWIILTIIQKNKVINVAEGERKI